MAIGQRFVLTNASRAKMAEYCDLGSVVTKEVKTFISKANSGGFQRL